MGTMMYERHGTKSGRMLPGGAKRKLWSRCINTWQPDTVNKSYLDSTVHPGTSSIWDDRQNYGEWFQNGAGRWNSHTRSLKQVYVGVPIITAVWVWKLIWTEMTTGIDLILWRIWILVWNSCCCKVYMDWTFLDRTVMAWSNITGVRVNGELMRLWVILRVGTWKGDMGITGRRQVRPFSIVRGICRKWRLRGVVPSESDR